MEAALLIALVCLVAVALFLLVLLLRRAPAQADFEPLFARLDSLEKQQDRAERSIREESARALSAGATSGKELREEVSRSLAESFGTLSTNHGDRLTDFAKRLDSLTISNNDGAAKLRKDLGDSASLLRQDVTVQVQAFREASVQSVGTLATQVSQRLESFAAQLAKLTESVDARLAQLQAANEARLEKIRLTVDEKLQSTLNQRLGESFKQVSDRLEQVHKGLGEMQSLSAGVTDLKRVMTNVKSRGTWAEWQLGNLLEDVLSPDQFTANFVAKERSKESVEFAVRLPGRSDDDEPVWLPIDSKFPKEDYERLTAAAERADAAGVEEAGKQLEVRIKQCARDIRDKYINPPRTTDWGMLFLPTEGLFAEVLRRPGLVAHLQRDCRIAIAGPTTLAAYLNALHMGFRTLAIQKKSGEVWKVLGAVKKQFDDFGPMLQAVHNKLEDASRSLGKAADKTTTIRRSLEKVEELPGVTDKPGALSIAETVVAPLPLPVSSLP